MGGGGGEGQIGQIWGPFMITCGLSCYRVGFGKYFGGGGGGGGSDNPPDYGPGNLGTMLPQFCNSTEMHIAILPVQCSTCDNVISSHLYILYISSITLIHYSF